MTPARRTALVFILAALALFATMTRRAIVFDEGIVFGGAMRVLAGQSTHIDFYSCYGPAVYWAVALLFKLTGPGMLAGRLLGVAVAAAAVALGHALIARTTRPLLAFAMAALLAVWFMGIGSFLYPVYPCIALALAGALLLAGEGGAHRPAALIGAGACCGLSALFRYDAGFFTLAAFMAASALVLVRREGWTAAIRAAAWLSVGAGIAFLLPAAVWLAPDPAGALAAFKADIIDYPLQWYGPMRGMPWPGPAMLAKAPIYLSVYLPPLFVLLALPLLRDDLRRAGGRIPASILLAALTVALFYKGMVRVSPMHMLMAIAPSWLLLGLVLERWSAGTRAMRRAAIALAVFMVLLGLNGLRDALHVFRADPRSTTWVWLGEKAGLFPARADVDDLCPTWAGMAGTTMDDHYVRAAWFLLRHSAPQDRVLVGLGRTDRVFVNPMLLNYAANRLPGTHWSQYDPGLQNRADIQRQMVAELASGSVPWVVRDTSFDSYIEPNGSSWHSGVTLLDDYVDAHYRPVGRAAGLSIWLRRNLPAPDTGRDPAPCRLDPA